ncbi:hypothetical protein KC218_26225, partial [Mycobacterium tuberculosis]|nr:hypothetical protein [Mycobacterium tuberculosis]
DKIIGESLKPRGLSDGDSVMLCRMNEASFRWVDARRCHRGTGLAGVYATVHVIVPVMVNVTG